jgi:class 3 adenylate cyclase
LADNIAGAKMVTIGGANVTGVSVVDQIRVGVHTGECERRGDDLAGLGVHIAARVGATAGPNQVLVTSTVRDLVLGSDIDFHEAGKQNLKGVPGTWTLLAADT